jgi:hypothetical protein
MKDEGDKTMDIHNFKTLVESLEALPEELKNSRFDLGDPAIPNCGHRGCFAGLISIVAYDIYQLHNIYRRNRWRDNFCEHEPTGWAYTLNVFLGCDFAKWARANPEIWGYEYGMHMWHSKTAFGVVDHERITHDMMIIHMRHVFNRLVVFHTTEDDNE